jgi:hypothetical protein
MKSSDEALDDVLVNHPVFLGANVRDRLRMLRAKLNETLVEREIAENELANRTHSVVGRQVLDEQLARLAADIAFFERRIAVLQYDPKAAPLNGRTPIAHLIHEVLADGHLHNISEIKALAEKRGIDFGNKSAGRVLHGALVGMRQHGIVEMVSPARWRWRERENSQ